MGLIDFRGTGGLQPGQIGLGLLQTLLGGLQGELAGVSFRRRDRALSIEAVVALGFHFGILDFRLEPVHRGLLGGNARLLVGFESGNFGPLGIDVPRLCPGPHLR